MPAVLTVASKESFFDREAVQQQVQEATLNHRALNRTGGMIRTIARGLIRRVKKRTTVSPPGQPPRSRDPQGRYKRIIYAWDAVEKGVVVGHVGYKTKGNPSTVPSTHEFGKSAQVPRVMLRRPKPVNWTSQKAKQRRNRAFKRLMRSFGPFQEPGRNRQLATGRSRFRSRARIRMVTVRYPPRPVMQPALSRARERLPGIWADAVSN
jgi:hypothetical protein